MSLRIVGLAGMLALTACGGDGESSGQAQSLDGTHWMLVSIGERPVVQDSRASLSFNEPGAVAGHGSCNRFAGPVSVTGDQISFGNLASTRMACQPEVDVQEMDYLQALTGANRYRINGSQLEIETDDPSFRLRFEQAASLP